MFLLYPEICLAFCLLFGMLVLCCLVSKLVIVAVDVWIFWKSTNFLLEVTSTSNETSIGCFVGSKVMSPDALGFSSSVWIVSKANGFVDVCSCWFALDFFAEKVWLVLRNFDNSGCVLLFVGKKKEGFVLGGIYGGWSRALTSLLLAWTACVDFSVRVGDDLLDSRRRELHFELTLMSFRNRLDDWLSCPSSSRLLTSCSKICNFERRFDCLSVIDETLLGWGFSRKTFSAAFLSSSFVSLMLFIRRVSVLKLFFSVKLRFAEDPVDSWNYILTA